MLCFMRVMVFGVHKLPNSPFQTPKGLSTRKRICQGCFSESGGIGIPTSMRSGVSGICALYVAQRHPIAQIAERSAKVVKIRQKCKKNRQNRISMPYFFIFILIWLFFAHVCA